MKRRTYIFGLSKLHIEFGDITTSNAEVIVSSDDHCLSMGGGVSAAIRHAGGEAITLDAAKKKSAILGDVLVTTAGRLPAQHIFHAITIGPRGREVSSEEIIESTVRRSLELLHVMHLHSIAFPTIGAGAANFDLNDIAVKMAEEIASFLAEQRENFQVTLYLFDRFGIYTSLDYSIFFEEFRMRVSTVAAYELEPDPTSVQDENPPLEGLNYSTQVRRHHDVLKDLASLGEQRNTLEESLVKMTVLGDKKLKNHIRAALKEIEDQRIEYLAELQPDRKTSLNVFFSYSHKDELLRDELAKHLNILERQEVIAGWHDRDITAGTDWKEDISSNLDTADIVLLLISSDFIASDYCYDIELKHAMKRHEAEEAIVIPIILRPVSWSGTSFAKLQVLPKDGKPVTKWNDQDSAFLNITEGLMNTIEELNARQSSTLG